ncbi:MAG: DUF2125 domain-containing protein [Alphaproteobacteria bacterium]
MLSRRILIGSLALLLLVAGAYAGYWFYAAGLARDAVERWAAARRAEGYTVDYRAGSAEGFPLTIRLPLQAPKMAGPVRTAPADAFSWEADAVGLEMQPWDPFRYRIEAHGTQRVAVQVRGEWQRYALDAGHAVGMAALRRDGRLEQGAFDLSDLRMTDTAGRPVLQARRAAARTLLPAKPPAGHTEQAAELSMLLHDALFPAAAGEALGPEVAKLEFVVDLKGPVPAGPERAALEAWRRDGGTVEVEWLNLVWGPLDLRAKGTAALDEAMRPLGALTADVRGYGPALDAFAKAGAVKPEMAATARLALDLLARQDGTSGERVLTVPLTAQDGALFVGPVRLFSLRPIPL